MRNRGGRKSNPAPQPSRADLQNRIDALESENETLNDKLDSILDIASDEDDDDDDDDDD
jgi:hypothetical protein